ncbi:MAG: sulfatase-like hydrolase/transferase, partial [Myxococcota bacterium]|nr:sulfatase-like hydrolase/transferase [Myxococcota bacterium]
ETKGMATRGLGEQDIEHLRAHYDSSVRGADYQLGRILYALQERDILEDSWVIVLSDHGESLGEDGRFGHESEAGDEVFHVPLVVKTAQATEPTRWAGMVMLSDVLPTMVERIGAQIPAGVESKSFLGALGREKPFPESHEVIRSASVCCYWVRSAGWELRGWKDPHRLRQVNRERRWTLYENGAGPNVLDQHAQIAENLKTYVSDWPEHLKDAAKVGHGPAGHDPETRRMLREKGYWAPEVGGER